MESNCFRKRKREGAAGQLEQSHHFVGLQEVPLHPEWVDLSGPRHGFPLPPGWEQCLDLQSGQMYFVNSATQARVASDPRMAAGHGNNGKCNTGMTLGLDLDMKLPSSAIGLGMPGLPSRDELPEDQLHGCGCPSSSLNSNGGIMNPDISMAATVCLHCHTFVMVSRVSPHCPSCKNLCNVNPPPVAQGNS